MPQSKNMKKVIVVMAVVQLQEKSIAPLHFARATYLKKLAYYGLMPIFVTSTMSDEMINEAYDMCDGALFMGGSDFDPSLYNQIPHEFTQANELSRDKIELYLLKKILADRKPFLGICRGCQALNIATGGDLLQHVPDITIEENHGIGEGNTYERLLTNPKHEVSLVQNSKINQIMGKLSVMVNSGHHQAINSPGSNIVITGRSLNSIVEVIEHIDPDFFCFGIQSHPEAEDESFFEEVFAGFTSAIKIYTNRLKIVQYEDEHVSRYQSN